MADATGLLALVGGGEWTEGCDFDADLLAASGGEDVVVLPTAAAYERPERTVLRASEWFAGLGARVEGLMVVGRRDAEDDGLAAPASHGLGFGQAAAGVVPALGEDVGPQALEDGVGRVLVEDGDRVDAVERQEHRLAVGRRHEGTPGALQAADRLVGVEAHDEAAPQGSGRLQHRHVPGVEQVEAPTGRHDGPTTASVVVRQVDGVGRPWKRVWRGSRGRRAGWRPPPAACPPEP